ncbi:MAG: hypothetical protein AAF984_01120 [Verrucomicrobiota bacterium]
MKILMSFVLLASPVQARLGETVVEIERRFGKALKTQRLKDIKLDLHTYQNGDLIIDIFFAEGKSVSEQYLRVKAGKEKTIQPIDKPLADAILKANVQGSKWVLISKEGARPHRYLREDKNAIASVIFKQEVIAEVRISSQQFNDSFEKAQERP